MITQLCVLLMYSIKCMYQYLFGILVFYYKYMYGVHYYSTANKNVLLLSEWI